MTIKKIGILMTAALLAGCSTNTAATATVTPTATPTAAATASASADTVTTTGTSQAGSVTLNTTEADMSGYEWLNDDNAPFVEITLKESVRMFTEGGTGILYYGKTGCPWCQRAIPVADEAAQETGVTIYYIDVSQPVAEADYNELCTYLNDIFQKDSNGDPMFQVPEFVVVKDGKITGHHLSLVDSFSMNDTETNQMDEAQTQELLNIYLDIFKAVE